MSYVPPPNSLAKFYSVFGTITGQLRSKKFGLRCPTLRIEKLLMDQSTGEHARHDHATHVNQPLHHHYSLISIASVLKLRKTEGTGSQGTLGKGLGTNQELGRSNS